MTDKKIKELYDLGWRFIAIEKVIKVRKTKW